MPNRALHLGLLVVLSATAIAVAWCSPPYERKPPIRRRPALALVPSGAEIVVTARVEQLRTTTLGRLLTAQGRQLPEIGTLEQVCGFDPTEQIRELIVAVPTMTTSTGSQTDFAIAVAGDFEAVRLVGCASSVVRHRGGEPAATPIGTFTTIRDRRNPEKGEIAVRDGGPAILGGGNYLRDLIDVAEGRGRSALDEGLHRALRQTADPANDGAIVASWLPGPEWFEPVDPEGVRPAAAVRGLALRVGVSPDLYLRLVLACSPAAGCDPVTPSVRNLRSKLALPAHDFLGLDLDRVAIEQHTQHVELSLRLSSSEAESFIGRVLGALRAENWR